MTITKGLFENNLPHGRGDYTSKSGEYCKGDFTNGKFNGQFYTYPSRKDMPNTHFRYFLYLYLLIYLHIQVFSVMI